MVIEIRSYPRYWVFTNPVSVKKSVIENDVGYKRDKVVVLDSAGVEHEMVDDEGSIRINIKETE